MNINAAPDQVSRSPVQIAPGYMSGFRNSFETESLPGALPIGPALCSITWVERREVAQQLLRLEPEGLLRELQDRVEIGLEGATLCGTPTGHPLGGLQAVRYGAPRVALVGDAAHGLHPIHAQGFNLAVRDVTALAEVVADSVRAGADPGGAEALLRYDCLRRTDAWLTVVVLLVVDDHPLIAPAATHQGHVAFCDIRRAHLLALERVLQILGCDFLPAFEIPALEALHVKDQGACYERLDVLDTQLLHAEGTMHLRAIEAVVVEFAGTIVRPFGFHTDVG